MATNAMASTIATTSAAAASLNVRSALMSSDAEMIGNSNAAAQTSANQARRDRFGTSAKPAVAIANQIRLSVSSIATPTVYDYGPQTVSIKAAQTWYGSMFAAGRRSSK